MTPLDEVRDNLESNIEYWYSERHNASFDLDRGTIRFRLRSLIAQLRGLNDAIDKANCYELLCK